MVFDEDLKKYLHLQDFIGLDVAGRQDYNIIYKSDEHLKICLITMCNTGA